MSKNKVQYKTQIVVFHIESPSYVDCTDCNADGTD